VPASLFTGQAPERCLVCGARVDGPGEPGKAVVEAMLDVLADPLGTKRHHG
jgi:hypothetical protein